MRVYLDLLVYSKRGLTASTTAMVVPKKHAASTCRRKRKRQSAVRMCATATRVNIGFAGVQQTRTYSLENSDGGTEETHARSIDLQA